MIDSDVGLYEVFHRAVFDKDPRKSGVLWEQLKVNPAEGLQAIMTICQNPNMHTLETGFILGVTLAYALQKDPLRVLPILDAMKFTARINDHANK